MAGTVPDFHLGDKAKATLGGVRIKGLNKLVVPGIERKTVNIEEFGQDFDYEVPTSGAWSQGEMSGNYVRGDVSQRAIRQKLFSNEPLAELRLFEDAEDFWTVDLANDPNAAFRVKGVPGPSVEKSGVIPFSATVLVQGRIALFDTHLMADTLAFVAASRTITDSGNGFVVAGFTAGQSLIVDGSGNNDGHYLIKTVEAGVITLADDAALVDEAAAAIIEIHGGKL